MYIARTLGEEHSGLCVGKSRCRILTRREAQKLLQKMLKTEMLKSVEQLALLDS